MDAAFADTLVKIYTKYHHNDISSVQSFNCLYLCGIRKMKYLHQRPFPIEKHCNNCKISFLELAVVTFYETWLL